jgi:hypothetical protein
LVSEFAIDMVPSRLDKVGLQVVKQAEEVSS